MIYLTAKEILKIHATLTERTGGSAGLRDKNLLWAEYWLAVRWEFV